MEPCIPTLTTVPPIGANIEGQSRLLPMRELRSDGIGALAKW